jgi:uncharacterized membrane protein YdjX (TVP38/TMEM64 family)
VNVTRRLLLRALFVAAAVIVLSVFWGRLDLAELHARARDLPGVAVIAAITLLPMVGFPVSWLHLVAGVRFGFVVGMVVVAVTSVLHHVLCWGLTRLLPARFFARLEPWRERLRGAGHRDATLLCCLLPGMPYTVQLYLMPIIGVPFGLMFGLSSLLHTGRAVVTILLGDMSDELTPAKVAVLALYYCALFAGSVLALRGLRRSMARHASPP